MTDNTVYIDFVKSKFQIDNETCRRAFGFKKMLGGKNIAIDGFVVGGKYFINPTTYEIYETSAFYLINYLDENDD